MTIGNIHILSFLGNAGVLVPYIMGKSAKWLKNVLLGKKTSKSSGSKGKEVMLSEELLYAVIASLYM